LIFGLAVLAAGVLLAFDRLDLLSFELSGLWGWAPAILVVVGGLRLLQAGSAEARRGGWALVAVGLWLVVSLQSFWGLDFGTSWPLLLMLLGAARLADPVSAEDRPGGLWLLGIGTFFFVVMTDFLGLSFRTAWPLLLIVAGAALTWSALLRGRKPGYGKRRLS
jgi:hypothetical protein